jgi:hypothetical protein
MDEKQVGDNAVRMLENSLRQKTLNFKDHINRNPEDISIKNASAKAKIKKYGRKKNGTVAYYMRSLSIDMAKHGFILNYGINNRTRSGGFRQINGTRYSFQAHTMNMKATPFIDDAIKNSAVIAYVQENISNIRLSDLTFFIKSSLEESNPK